MNQRTNYVPGQMSARATPLYDTYQLAATQATPTTITFFGRTAAANGANITNLVRAFEVPPPGWFLVCAMRFVSIGMDEADLRSLAKNYVARLKLGGQKTPMLEAPIEYFAGGAGITGVVATTATSTTIKEWTNGVADPRAVASLYLPAIGDQDYTIDIGGGEHFQVDLEGTSFTATAAIFLRCYLDGVLHQGIRA